jgi:hydrogen peroxide-dependent heme synthase
MTIADKPITHVAPLPATASDPATAFTVFWLFQADPNRPQMSEPERAQAAESLVNMIGRHTNSVQVRGAYSTAGLSAGVNLILWLVADNCDAFQELASEIHRTPAGRMLSLRHVYLGVASMSQYDPNHGAAFLRGLAPKQYLSVYPFTKTIDWYLLPYEQRRDLMVEHGRMGQEYPSIQTNTVNSFGIADQEFIVALEDDDPGTLVKMVQRLRAAEVRKYTSIDTPIFLGRLMDLRTAIENAI